MPSAVRSIGPVRSLSEDRIGGYLVIWGSPQQLDLRREYFTPESELALDWYPVRPLLYQHGLDGKMSTLKAGVIDVLEKDDVGVWMEAQLDIRNKYVAAVKRLADTGALGTSSGSMDHLVEIDKNGFVRRWPIVEGSLTPNPVEPRTNARLIPNKHLIDRRTARACIRSVATDESLEALLAKAGIAMDDSADEVLPNLSDWSRIPLFDKEAPMPTENENPAVRMDGQQPPEEQTRMAIPAETLQALVQKAAQVLNPQATPEQIAQIVNDLMAAMEQETAPAAASANPAVLASAVKSLLGDAAFFDQHVTSRLIALRSHADVLAAADQHLNRIQNMAGQGGTPAPAATTRKPANVSVGDQYPEMDAADMAFYLHMRNEWRRVRNSGQWVPDQNFYRELAAKFEKEAGKHLPYLPGADRDPQSAPAVRAIRAIRADELLYTTQTGYGAEWIPMVWSNQLFPLVRRENPVAGLFQNITMPSNPFKLPIEGDDPVLFRVAETKNDSQIGPPGTAPATKFGTKNTQMQAYKVGLRMPFSYEMDDLSVIQFIPEARRKVTIAFAEGIDRLILNADPTTGLGNVNAYTTNIATDAPSAYLLGFKGLVKLIMEVAEANRAVVNAGNGFPTLSQMRAVQRKLWSRIGDKYADLVWLVDPLTHQTMKEIPQIQTLDQLGPNAVILKGEVMRLDNIPIISTDQLGLSDATGLIHGTAGNNTQGRALLVYRPHFKPGYLRNVDTWFKYYEESDSYQLGAWLEMAFHRLYDGLATAAMLTNIAV